MDLLPGRSADSINSRIRRLKSAGKIKGYRKEETLKRSYKQRGKKALFDTDK